MQLFKRLPVLLQSDMSECGLVSLGMILIYHKYIQNVAALKTVAQTAYHDASLYQLKKLAEQFGLAADVLRIELNQLHLVKLPCIAYWQMNHFVVIQAIKKKHIVLHDPARGLRKISFKTLQSEFTGLAIELTPLMQPKRLQLCRVPQGFTLKVLLRNHYLKLLQLLIASLFIQCLSIAGIQCFRYCIDVVNFREASPTHFILSIVFIFWGIKVIEICAQGMRSIMLSHLGARLNEKLAVITFAHLFTLPFTFFERRHLGDMVSRFSSIDKIRTLMTEHMLEGIVDGFISILTLVIIIKCSLQISLCIIFFSLIYVVLRLFGQRLFQEMNEEWLHWRAIENSHFIETLRAMPSIKVFEKSHMRQRLWRHYYLNQLNASTQLVQHKTLFDTVKSLLHTSDLALTLFLGCAAVLSGQFTIGMFSALLAYRLQFVSSITGWVDKISELRLLTLHLQKINGVMQVNPENDINKASSLPFQKRQVCLQLKNIAFGYPSQKPIFTAVNLTVSPGETLAIVGESGSGKTTLLKIMLTLIKPTSGQLYMNDISIYPQHVIPYRKSIAAVLQEDFLLTGTLFENISYFDENPNYDRVYEAAELAGIFHEITALPMGFWTRVGGMSSLLSGGQKQRILLARALYARPSILFLDEATSHLDAAKEKEVNLSIRKLNITTVLIAHRQETIAMADKIYSLTENLYLPKNECCS